MEKRKCFACGCFFILLILLGNLPDVFIRIPVL